MSPTNFEQLPWYTRGWVWLLVGGMGLILLYLGAVALNEAARGITEGREFGFVPALEDLWQEARAALASLWEDILEAMEKMRD